MLGGGKNPELINYDDEQISDILLEENKKTLGIEDKPDFKK